MEFHIPLFPVLLGRSEYDLTIETGTMPLEYKAYLLGHAYDKTTGTVKATADDAANDTSEYDLTIETGTMPLEYKAYLLGHAYDKTTGTVKATADDAAPYFMVAFTSTKKNGKKRYVKFHKVLFSEPDETAKTKEASVSYNTPSLSAKAIYRTSDKVVYEQADEEADGYVATAGTNWFITNPSA